MVCGYKPNIISGVRSMQKVPMTKMGEEKLKQELHLLKSVERPNIIQAIAEARAHGDLKENAEYHAAKERQGFVEGRIADIEHKLSHAHVIDITKMTASNKVIFGSTVTLVNVANDKEITYQIVGEDEADINAGKVSVNSPIARAIIGKEIGDVAAVQTPSGTIEYEISALTLIA
jgi:transcription elongation factor GreA